MSDQSHHSHHSGDERPAGLGGWTNSSPPLAEFKPTAPDASVAVKMDDRVAGLVILDDRIQFRTYKRRWFMLALYCLLNFMNSVTLITFSAVSTAAARYYDVSTTAINALVVVFAIGYVPGYPIASWVFMKHHTKRAILVGGAFTAVGSAIRLLSVESLARDGQARTFAWLMVGQCIAAIANPFFTNAPARISADWFADDERALATTIGAMFTPVGVALGQLVPSAIVDEFTGEGIPTMLLIEACISVGLWFAFFFFFQPSPPTPPSKSNAQIINLRMKQLKKTEAYKHVLEMKFIRSRYIRNVVAQTYSCFLNKEYLKLLLLFSVGLSGFNGCMSLIEQLIRPSGYSSANAGAYGGIVILFGMFGALVNGPILDRTKKFNQALKTFCVTTWFAVLYLFLVMRPNQKILLGSGFAFAGFAILPILPICFECAAECTYPVAEDISTGILNVCGNLLGVLTIFLMDALIKLDDQYDSVVTPVAIFLVLYLLIVVASALWYNGDYVRMKSEAREEDSSTDVVLSGPRSSSSMNAPPSK